jgi:hypothetical protein
MSVSTIAKAICIIRRKRGFSSIFVIKGVEEKQGVRSGPGNFFIHGGEPRNKMTEAAAYHFWRTPSPPSSINDPSPRRYLTLSAWTVLSKRRLMIPAREGMFLRKEGST